MTIDEKALQRVIHKAKPAIDRMGGKALQTAADEVWRRHTRQPVDKVRAAIKAHPTFRNLKLSETTINAMAETIASGKRFYLRTR
jgi:hypothetical protein